MRATNAAARSPRRRRGGSYVQGSAGGVASSGHAAGSLTNTTSGTIAGGAAPSGHIDDGARRAGVDLSSGSVTNAAAISGGLGGAGGALDGGGGGVGVAVSGASLTTTQGLNDGRWRRQLRAFIGRAGNRRHRVSILSSGGVSNAQAADQHRGRGGDLEVRPAGGGGAGAALVSGSLTNTGVGGP